MSDHVDPTLERILKAQEAADLLTPAAAPADELARYRFPDGTLDVDALELGQPSPGWIGVGRESTPGPATSPAPRPLVELAEDLFAMVDVGDLEREQAARLEALRRRREERALDDRANRLGWVLVLTMFAALILVVAGVVLTWPY